MPTGGKEVVVVEEVQVEVVGGRQGKVGRGRRGEEGMDGGGGRGGRTWWWRWLWMEGGSRGWWRGGCGVVGEVDEKGRRGVKR